MDKRKTKTGSVPNGIVSAVYVAASVQLNAAGSQMARFRDFEGAQFTNLGDTTLYVANLDSGDNAPTDADAVQVMAGQEIPIGRLNTGQLFIKSANVAGVNAWQMLGEPL